MAKGEVLMFGESGLTIKQVEGIDERFFDNDGQLRADYLRGRELLSWTRAAEIAGFKNVSQFTQRLLNHPDFPYTESDGTQVDPQKLGFSLVFSAHRVPNARNGRAMGILADPEILKAFGERLHSAAKGRGRPRTSSKPETDSKS